jgi:hypothetical protein
MKNKYIVIILLSICTGCSSIKYTSRMSNQIDKHKLNNDKVVVLVDYGKSIYSTRFFVVSPKKKKVIFATTAGHGYKSGIFYASEFSNVPRSHKSSLGLYRVGSEYDGKFGRSRKLHGLSKTNSLAYRRFIVFHGQPSYKLWSLGCITVPNSDIKKVLKLLKKGTKIIVFD